MIKLIFNPLLWIILMLLVSIVNMRSARRIDKAKKWWYLIVLSTLFLYVLSLRPVMKGFAYPLERDYINRESKAIQDIDYVIILGGGAKKVTFDTKTYPIGATFERLMYGIQIFEKHKAKFLILSGGNKTCNRNTEAQTMAWVAMRMGVPKSKIILEETSRNTWEQAAEINKIIHNPGAIIGIVSSGIHIKRSIKSFEKYFTNVMPFPCNFLSRGQKWSFENLLPSSRNLSDISMIIIEYIGIGWYAFNKRFG